MKGLHIVFQLMWTEKKTVWIAILLGFLAALSSVGLLGTGGYLISQAALQPPLYTLTMAIVGVRFFGIARAVSRYAERYFSHKATFSILGKLRVWFYERIEPLAPAVLQKHRSGDLLARIVSDVDSLQFFFLRVLYPPLIMVAVFFTSIVFLQFFAWQIGALMLLALIVAGILLPVLQTLAVTRQGEELRVLRSRLAVLTTDLMYGYVDLWSNNLLADKQQELRQTSSQLLEAQRKNANTLAIGEVLAMAVAFLVTWLVLVIGVVLTGAGQLNGLFLAMLVLIALTTFEAVVPVSAIPAHYEESKVAAQRLTEIAPVVSSERSAEHETKHSEEYSQEYSADSTKKIKIAEAGSLMFSNVSFAYPDEQRMALADINYTVYPKRKVAIVGASGSGKSSLFQLLLRFYQPTSGAIHLGDKSHLEVPADEWRNSFAVVSQENHFFHATVRQNLKLAKPTANDEELLDVLQKVQLPNISLDEIIGERGLRLSGGERQRLAIARMLLKDAKIILLDELANGLDVLTEQKILEMLWKLLEDKSVLYITHRLVGLEMMDEVLLMEAGKLYVVSNSKTNSLEAEIKSKREQIAANYL